MTARRALGIRGIVSYGRRGRAALADEPHRAPLEFRGGVAFRRRCRVCYHSRVAVRSTIRRAAAAAPLLLCVACGSPASPTSQPPPVSEITLACPADIRLGSIGT